MILGTVAATTQTNPAMVGPHTFSLPAPSGVSEVYLAGDFDNWQATGLPMKLGPNRKNWTITVNLPIGVHQYKFVLNGKTWITDPNAWKNVNDGNGNFNSEVLITPADYATAAKVGDGVITASALQFSLQLQNFNWDRGNAIFTFRSRPDDIAHITLNINGHGYFPLQKISEDDIFQYSRVQVPWGMHRDLDFNFQLTDGPTTEYYGPKGVTSSAEGNTYDVSAKTYTPFVPPKWVEHSVIYEIFPDRWANGNSANDEPNVMPWNGTPTYFNYFGGDLQGVQDHLSYLKSLGISCVYFTPIFEGPSNHKYETTDYHLIDPGFGTNALFDSLSKRMNADGIKVVLDGVFNHSSTSFFAFQNVVEHGAASPFVHWYTFKSFPVKIGPNPNYVAWMGYQSMPKFNHANPEVQKYLLGVPGYWNAQADVSGWRLDSAPEVPFFFWKKFRTRVKALNQNDWIVGEQWGDATPWLQGDMWDSVMNYPFLFDILGFVGSTGDGKPSELIEKLMANYSSYAPQVSRNLMNLIGSHDTPRILDQCGGNLKLSHLAAILEFGWVGTPMVYYGDELGMAGGKDPANRRTMEWGEVTASNPTLTLYRQLIAARNESPELQAGDPVPLLANDNDETLAFGRVLRGKAAIVAVNRSTTSRLLRISVAKVGLKPGDDLTNVLTGEIVTVNDASEINLPLAAASGTLLIPEKSVLLKPLQSGVERP